MPLARSFTYSFFICSSINLFLHFLFSFFSTLSSQLPPFHSPPLSLSLSPASRSGNPACSRLCAISPYFSLVNILSRLSSIIFIAKKKGACVPRCFYPHSSLWNISVPDEVTICLHISGGLLIRECRSGIVNFDQQGLMKKAWSQTVVSWHRASDDKLKFKHYSYLLRSLWPHR